MFSGHGRLRHEAADVAGGVAVGEFGEGVGQPVVGIKAAELAGLDERHDHRPVVTAFVRACEAQRILAIQSDRPKEGAIRPAIYWTNLPWATASLNASSPPAILPEPLRQDGSGRRKPSAN